MKKNKKKTSYFLLTVSTVQDLDFLTFTLAKELNRYFNFYQSICFFFLHKCLCFYFSTELEYFRHLCLQSLIALSAALWKAPFPKMSTLKKAD